MVSRYMLECPRENSDRRELEPVLQQASEIASRALGVPCPRPRAATNPSAPAAPDRWLRLPSGDRMHYVEAGPADGKPVLLVHGYPTSAYLYRNVMRELCPDLDSPYRCIAPTLIGFGASSCPGDGRVVTPAYHADRLDEFIRAMQMEDFALVVHDWGGPVAVAAALRHAAELSHVVILNSSLRLGSDGWLRPLMAMTDALTSGPVPLAGRAYAEFVGWVIRRFTATTLPPEVVATYRAPFMEGEIAIRRLRASLRLLGQAHESEALQQEIARGLATWSRPALFLWGTDDPFMGPTTACGAQAHVSWARLLPQALTVLIDGANHFMPEDRPIEIAARIERFLQSGRVPRAASASTSCSR